MDMTARQQDVLRSSFRQLAAEPETTAALFYDMLFEVAPATRSLFSGDMAAQGTKMMNTLGSIVARIDEAHLLRPMLHDLAQRHVGYGVQPDHYGVLGTVLLATVQRRLGERFTPDVEAAWTRAYAGVADAMLEAASSGRRR